MSVGRLVTISNTCFSHIMISAHTNLFFLLLPFSLLSFPSSSLLSPPPSSFHRQDPDYVVEMNEEHPEFKKLAFTSPGPKNAFAPLKRVLGRKGTSFVKSENDGVFTLPGEDYEQEMGGTCMCMCVCAPVCGCGGTCMCMCVCAPVCGCGCVRVSRCTIVLGLNLKVSLLQFLPSFNSSPPSSLLPLLLLLLLPFLFSLSPFLNSKTPVAQTPT